MRNETPPFEETTLWYYPEQSYGEKPKGDPKFQGVTPAYVIWNLVQRYTKPGDLVVDPMAGSGTTIDVCKEEGRNVIGYDINPQHPSVIKNDSREIPLEDNSVDMVFIDSSYTKSATYFFDERDIGGISIEDSRFYKELEKIGREIFRILKPDKIVGWLVGDRLTNEKFVPVGFRVYQMLTERIGFEPLDVICVALKLKEPKTKIWQRRSIEFNFLLRGFKYLILARKPENK